MWHGIHSEPHLAEILNVHHAVVHFKAVTRETRLSSLLHSENMDIMSYMPS